VDSCPDFISDCRDGVKMDTLMRMQSAYEIAQTRKREKLIRVRRVLRAA
jgi:plasmid maintenance system antidote protein VapI